MAVLTVSHGHTRKWCPSTDSQYKQIPEKAVRYGKKTLAYDKNATLRNDLTNFYRKYYEYKRFETAGDIHSS